MIHFQSDILLCISLIIEVKEVYDPGSWIPCSVSCTMCEHEGQQETRAVFSADAISDSRGSITDSI